MENPKLALIPSGYKSGKVYSILPVNGVGDFDFIRNTESSRVNKEGLIETVDDNVPKLDWLNSDCPSLLLEPQRTNYVNYSQDITQSIWNKKNINYDSNVIDPSGNANAFKIYPNTTYGEHYLEQSNLATTQTTYSGSVFIKDGGTSVFEIIIVHVGIGSAISRATFTITNGVVNFNTLDGVIQSVNIKYFDNGWYKCELKYNFSSSVSSHRMRVLPKNNTQYVGDNFSGVNVYGIQVEQGSYPTSYIKTTGSGSAVTRLKDGCNNAGDSQLLNNSENTFFIDLNKIYKTGTGDSRISLNDGSTTNRVLFSTQTNDTTIILYSIRGGTTTTVKYFSIDYDARNKIAYTFKDNEIKFYVNGEKIHEALFLPIPLNLSKISFDENNGGSRAFQGEVNEIRYYDRVLTEAEAIELTK